MGLFKPMTPHSSDKLNNWTTREVILPPINIKSCRNSILTGLKFWCQKIFEREIYTVHKYREIKDVRFRFRLIWNFHFFKYNLISFFETTCAIALVVSSFVLSKHGNTEWIEAIWHPSSANSIYIRLSHYSKTVLCTPQINSFYQFRVSH